MNTKNWISTIFNWLYNKDSGRTKKIIVTQAILSFLISLAICIFIIYNGSNYYNVLDMILNFLLVWAVFMLELNLVIPFILALSLFILEIAMEALLAVLEHIKVKMQ